MLPPDASGDFHRVLLESMSEGVSLTTAEGVIVYTNPAEDLLFGYPAGALVGQHVSIQNAYPPEENKRIVEAVIAELERSGSWRGDWLNRRRDGSTFVTRARIDAVDIGGSTHWLCVREDVSHDRRSEAALRESEARLDLATASAGIGIWDWDLLTGAMTYSPIARRISGLSPDEEVTLERVAETVHPDDLPQTRRMAQRALDPAVRAQTPYQYRIVHEDGSVRWVLAHGEAMFAEIDGEDRAVRYVGTIQDITGRRQLEDARHGSERRLRLAIDAGRMAVWEVDLREDRLIGSPELNRLLGFAEDDEIDLERVRAGYLPGERERLQEISQRATAAGEPFIEAEYRYLRPDGAVRWMMLRAEISLDAAKQPVRAVGVLMDVTERRETEEALRTGKARLRIALGAAGAGVFEWDVESGALEWSPELFLLYGIDPAAAEGRLDEAWRCAVHPADLPRVEADARAAAVEGGSFTSDFRILRPSDGEGRWIRAHGIAVAGADGKTSKLTGINLDVTDQHRGEESLRARAEETERERDRLYELSSDLFAVAGFDGYLKVVNPAWQKVLGSSAQELIASEFIGRIHPEDRARTAETVGLLRNGREIRHFENRLLHANGSAVWISWSAVAERNLFYAVGRDVTHEKERDEALRQAQKMEAVGHLTGGIAHDFNNLLQAVHGNFDLIRRRAEDERIARWAAQGLQAAERGARLTAQLLAFSRAQKLEVRPVDVRAMLTGMEDLLVRTLGPMIRVAIECTEEAVVVLGDQTQLEMAILNLAINARDAMPEGGALTVRADLCRSDGETGLEAGDYVRLALADDGVGMPADIAEQAFDPFFTTKPIGKGTGLGLSQVYGMARQAGGLARIRSAPGEGTTVTLLLRRTQSGEEENDLVQTRSLVRPTPSASVLVVDDDDDVRCFLADTLADLGYRVDQARGGEEALALLARSVPDLLLVDFAMPGMTGAELADRIRPSHPDLPVLLASGFADTAAVEAAIGPGACLLRKPFRIEELEAAVAAALRGRKR